jgi:hypothetical protein
VVTGIIMEKLNSEEMIANMVDELRYEIEGNTLRTLAVIQ